MVSESASCLAALSACVVSWDEVCSRVNAWRKDIMSARQTWMELRGGGEAGCASKLAQGVELDP